MSDFIDESFIDATITTPADQPPADYDQGGGYVECPALGVARTPDGTVDMVCYRPIDHEGDHYDSFDGSWTQMAELPS